MLENLPFRRNFLYVGKIDKFVEFFDGSENVTLVKYFDYLNEVTCLTGSKSSFRQP